MATTTNFGWETPDDTDLVKDGALAMRTLGNSIDSSFVDLKGGTTGQVLAKASNTDLDYTWVTQDDANAIQNAIVDARGDLIAASAADTPARLAVGNNGETLVADSSTSTGLRYNPQNALANPVINGGYDIWQRGTSIAVSSSSSPYTADRWQITTQTNQASTVSRQTVSDSTNLPNIQYACRVQRNSGQTGTATIQFGQSFETANSIPLAGKTVTVSFYARAGANYSASSSALSIDFISGTGTDQNRLTAGYTGNANVFSQSATLTTTWQRFAFTGTVPSTSTEQAILFLFVPTGTAGANDWYEVTGVQIDVGTYTASSAPTFRRSGGTLAGELAACQRYYFRAGGDNAYQYLSSGLAENSTQTRFGFQPPVQMRVAPTSLDFSTLATYDVGAAQILAVTNLTIANASRNMTSLTATVSGGLTTYRPLYLITNNSTSGFVGLSAEL